MSIAAASVLLGGAGCTSASRGSRPAIAGYPVTIAHRFGETTIPRSPKRVACIGYASHDTCIAFGVLPVAMSGNLVDGSKTPWFTAELNRRVLPTPTKYDPDEGFPIREIEDARPDLILAVNSTINESQYEQLTELAPVVAPPGPNETDWRTTTRIVAEALAVEDGGDQVIRTTEKRISKVRASYASLDGLAGVFADARSVVGADLKVYGASTNPALILKEYGLAPSAALEAADIPSEGTKFEAAADLDLSDRDLLLLTAPTKEVRSLRDSALGSARRSVVLDRGAEGYALIEASPLSVRWAAEPVIAELARAAFELDGRRS
ncbi:ABC transporter substrate-binding protein [Agromyces mediolanus]|uniref:ABC transporter substrate-binding protein n=1 Tax=Agromyces mediolanus TaxID=41986 RepID=UPI00203AB5D7|nr:ABC transporter substrate-binding protein [Agromyces mediolanus]MCM3656526.1 ABC transporter substrate-binding protein [Agromyces mediolanus]